MKFDYTRVQNPSDPAAPWIPIPFLKIRLINQQKVVQLNALVDSGADASIFHASIAEALGLDLKSGENREFFGVSGHSIQAYFHPIKLLIVGTSEPINLVVGFTSSPGVGALLGRPISSRLTELPLNAIKSR
jgi:hypothetical protein